MDEKSNTIPDAIKAVIQRWWFSHSDRIFANGYKSFLPHFGNSISGKGVDFFMVIYGIVKIEKLEPVPAVDAKKLNGKEFHLEPPCNLTQILGKGKDFQSDQMLRDQELPEKRVL